MTGDDRAGLIARIRQVRRLAQVRDQPASRTDDWTAERLRALEGRVAHLEQMLEGLQDSVHRESQRHEHLISAIQAQVQPGTMGAALADHTRHHGL